MLAMCSTIISAWSVIFVCHAIRGKYRAKPRSPKAAKTCSQASRARQQATIMFFEGEVQGCPQCQVPKCIAPAIAYASLKGGVRLCRGSAEESRYSKPEPTYVWYAPGGIRPILPRSRCCCCRRVCMRRVASWPVGKIASALRAPWHLPPDTTPRQ